MAEKIRGITIELGGDASGLEKALKDVNSEISNTSKQLKDVERLLKLDPKNTQLLAQKQKLLGQQIKNSNDKLKALKQAQETMDQNGVDKNSAQYMALQREITATENELKSLQTASQKTVTAMSAIGQAADKVAKGAQKVADKTKGLSRTAAAGLTALAGLGIKAAKDADELNTLAKQTGFSTDELQKFQYASDLVDVDLNDIVGAAAKMKKGLASSTKQFDKLGVKTKNADGSLRDVNEIFYDTIEALSGIPNETERDAAAMEIFGKSADSLAGIIDDGGKALKEYGDEAEQLGLVLDKDTIDNLNGINDTMDKLKGQALGTLAQTGAKAMEVLAPVLEKVVGLIGNLLTYIGQLTPEQMQIIMTIAAVVAAISPLASIISKISGLIAAIPTLIGGISTAINFLLANPIALLIAAIVGLVVLIATKGDQIQEKLAQFDAWLQGIFTKDWTETFGPVLGGVLNAFFDTVKSIWDSIKTIFDGVIDFIRGVFTGDWQRAWQGVKNIFSGIMSGLATVFKTPLNAIIRMVNGVIDGINWLIEQANKLAGIFGVQIGSIGHIPLLAEGGIVTKGSAIVGEAGPELLSVANGKATVRPLTGSKQTASTDEPITIVVQSVLDGRIVGESVTKYQGRMARANG